MPSLSRRPFLPPFLLVLVACMLILPLLGATAGTEGAPTSATGSAEINFTEDVWPILETSCLQCHDKATAYSNLRLDSPERILKGGDLGKVIVAGEPDNSPLVGRVSLPQDDLDFMPIEGDPLDENQIDILTQWIQQGAGFGDWTGTGQ